MDNFAVFPFPRGPLGNNLTTPGTTITDTRFGTAIPLLCKDPAMSAIILDAIYEPLPGYEEEQSVIDYLRHNFFFDDRDVENYINSFDNITDVYIGIKGNKSMREWLDQVAEADENNRQKYVINIETSIDEIMGK